ncbi:CMP-N-acetlyneuraminic acid synthetase [Halarcobacter ebronensis]|uniref:CMP-N-acetlyneuraminic acid synthetase n=1 Tax=Halarcobacter ebronensis TaxID=1462615 RepID=A0A4Q0YEM8_9BACT|nr:acylneuraminate cytidylyltransferase family protein [Halarcobacter ebronensis]RXJ68987.1 CMP-N-acetlyneuraminic acid synthetase [Halarcobacter ebronensis]
MYKGKTFLAIVPARGGSKRLPKKNLLPLSGKSLVEWSIEAGLKSNYIDEVAVTSDNNEILKLAQKSGATIIQRPEELASDTATTFDAIKHTIDNLIKYDYIILLQPTSPLRNYYHIDSAIEFLEEKEAEAVISVCEVDHSPLWSNTLDESLDMSNFLRSEIKNIRSQDLPQYYRLNGAIYICDTNRLLEEKTFFLQNNIYAFLMNRESSIDIDEEIDFKMAEFLLEREKR